MCIRDRRKIGEKWGVTPVIELMSFERGVFSSTGRYRVKFTLPAKDCLLYTSRCV